MRDIMPIIVMVTDTGTVTPMVTLVEDLLVILHMGLVEPATVMPIRDEGRIVNRGGKSSLRD